MLELKCKKVCLSKQSNELLQLSIALDFLAEDICEDSAEVSLVLCNLASKLKTASYTVQDLSLSFEDLNNETYNTENFFFNIKGKSLSEKRAILLQALEEIKNEHCIKTYYKEVRLGVNLMIEEIESIIKIQLAENNTDLFLCRSCGRAYNEMKECFCGNRNKANFKRFHVENDFIDNKLVQEQTQKQTLTTSTSVKPK